ncbi:MAG: HNH endonuclease, partial [Kofleriaceae bacterium]|nr:HNH endonuclease [Kofleriaceae bacterium]
DRGRQRADAFMDIIQDRLRGARPQRTPVEIIITGPSAGLHGSSEPSNLATLADGEIIAASTARRYCCDAGVVVATVDAHRVSLSVGRKTRTIPAAIKRALLLRDRTCRFPDCTHSRYVDGHHIEHWANGGETALANLMLLCSAHHTLLHEGGCRVEANAHGWIFFDHRNRIIKAQPARPNNTGARRGLAALRDVHAALAITANTNTSKWSGEAIDYARCIDYLV